MCGVGIVAGRDSAPSRRRPLLAIDRDIAHVPEVDDEPALADPKAYRAVAAASHGELEPVFPSECDGQDDIAGIYRADDQGWVTIESSDEHRPGVVILGIARLDDASFDVRTNRVEAHSRLSLTVIGPPHVSYRDTLVGLLR